MKKSLLALAVLASFAGVASAQTNVTVYGVVDAGIVHETGGAAGSSLRLSSGVQSGSRLGFKGTEDLGGGLSAKFQLEQGVLIDTGVSGQGGVLFGRQAWVGLGGNFGQVSAGRQYTPIFVLLDSIDPFGTGLTGDSQNLFVDGPSRMNNSVVYSTPGNLNGFNASVAYGFGEVAGDTGANRQVGFSAGYANGPLNVGVAYHNTNDATNTDSAKVTLVGGTYNFGVVTAHAAIGFNKGVGTLDTRDWLAGVTVPFGASSVFASYVRKDDRSAANQDANQFAVGYTYSLSKRTNVYASYARISNDNGAAYTVGDASNGYAGDKGLAVGIRHKF